MSDLRDLFVMVIRMLSSNRTLSGGEAMELCRGGELEGQGHANLGGGGYITPFLYSLSHL